MEPDGEGKPMTAVRGLDLERYMGRWYEIACFPSAFQPRDGRGTRATYALRPDGTVRVLNETWTADGSRRASIEGTAFRADPAADEARLKVRFYVPPFLPVFPVVGDYWVLFLDENYQYALVGQPSKKHLWIISFTFGWVGRYYQGRSAWKRMSTTNWWRRLENKAMM
ncbi:temperature-induced lipocalin-1-like isoform X2 [Phoenix dactylifera]|uniref:Temperature-induced lipocalin-1-like isoform X2 n=1 Tax=Phoenix dactylifera TaxID=42345 RepID=A0A8B7BKZ3_PHODC|nr:temperature-induced lipocalin-1-like isoform X2 [Phoenix dactylifera]